MFYVNSTENSFAFVKENGDQVLHVSKPDGDIRVENGSFSGASGAGLRKVDGILGIVRLRIGKYIVVITKSRSVGHIQDHEVFKAEAFDLLPLRTFKVKDETEQTYVKLINDHLMTSTLFYCHTFDLTNTFQRQQQSGSLYDFTYKGADTRFFWNHYISQDLIDAAQSEPRVSPFILPCIFGVVSLHDTRINNAPVTFGIITRRSRFRAGTRYFRRGIDNDGNVANFNETEQLLITSSQIFSYVQTRGSVPVFWSEINNLKYKPMLRIGDSPMASAQKHFDQQVHLYGKNYLVNLVNQKGYELPVKRAYENLVQALDNPELDYVYFDFHHECSKMRWHRVDVLIEELEKRGLDEQYWFQASFQPTEKELRLNTEQSQTSVVRTNCMDCLDRTNVVQSQLAKWVLQQQLVRAGLILASEKWDTVDPDFLFIFRNTWADNADGVSCAYSGTGALKTDFTRLGKRTKLGALQDLRNSIVRYVKNNYMDGPRQDAYDLFLGNHLPYETIDTPFVDIRPIWTQSVPYVLLGAVVMILAGVFFPKADAPVYVSRLFLLFWFVVVLLSLRSLIRNGIQYVNWPRLASLDFIREVESFANGQSRGWVWTETQAAANAAKNKLLDSEKLE